MTATTDHARPALVRLKSVARQYGTGDVQVRALDGIDLVVEPGETLAVVGPSGSGKTTLLSIIGLLERPTSGTVELDGNEVDHLSEEERADLRRSRIGFVFQLFHLVPALSALDNVLLPTLPDGRSPQPRARARELLARIGLEDRDAHRPGQLSGGEQQRVAIARALINEPTLLIADEPTGNLDSATSQQVVDLLLALQRERSFALIVATHDAALAETLGRCVPLADGRLRPLNAAEATPEM